MKTQIMFLDQQDDVFSIRDKMQWVKASRLLLVYPTDGIIHIRDLDLLLLRRHAESLGTHLGLVTKSRATRLVARRYGIPAFSSADEAQESTWVEHSIWKQPSRIRAKPDLSRMRSEVHPIVSSWDTRTAWRLVFFSLAVLATFMVLLLLIPSATITLYPVRESQTLKMDFSASPEYLSTRRTGEVPSSNTTWFATGSRTMTVTSRANVPVEYAEGEVTFTNLGMAVVGIPTGTIVRTRIDPSIRFVTLEDGVLAGQAGKTILIPVRALDPGTVGNLEENMLIVVDGNLGGALSATNQDPTTGGADRMEFVPSAADREKLHKDLMADLRLQLVNDLAETIEAGSLIFPDSIVAGSDMSETYSPKPGQPGTKLTLTVSGEFVVEYVSGSDIFSLANEIMDADLPAGSVPVQDTLVMELINPPVTSTDGITRWTANLQRSIHPSMDPSRAAVLVRARTSEVARQTLLAEYALVKPPNIKLVPSFWPWLPATSLRIFIIVE